MEQFPGQGWAEYQETPAFIREGVSRVRRARDEVARQKAWKPAQNPGGPVIA